MRLVVHDLAHRFPGTDLLFEHLDMTVDPGMTVAVCGPSGCGKSTLLSILAGWEKPYAGSVERIGIARTGWVFQNPVGVAQRSALGHVVFPLLAKGFSREEAEPQALEAMGLFDLDHAAGRRFSELPGGDAQCGRRQRARIGVVRRRAAWWHAARGIRSLHGGGDGT